MGLILSTDRTMVRAGCHSVRYITARYTAPPAPRRRERRPLDLAIVLDRSGSMAGAKIRLACQAARQAVKTLGPQDYVALVTYDSEVTREVAGARLDAEHRRRLLDAIDRISTGDMTNLSGGWLTGCEEVGRSAREDAVARVLLLSDGLANRGMTDRDELAHHAGELRARGVVTSCIGVGNDFDERLMEGMARAGGGNFYYLEQPEQIPDYLMTELGDALEVVARGAALEVDTDLGMELESMDGRVMGRQGLRHRMVIGDLVDGQEVELVLKVTFPRRGEGDRAALVARLVDRDGALDEAPATLAWEYAGHGANTSQPRDAEVDVLVASRYAALARRRAVEHNRAGNLDAAQRELVATARRIREYAGRVTALHQMADELEREAQRHEQRFTAHMMKVAYYADYNVMEGKAMDGRKRRGRREQV
ncbi:MAG: VWA domain-containing protein [Gemmatimonadales bacterium]